MSLTSINGDHRGPLAPVLQIPGQLNEALLTSEGRPKLRIYASYPLGSSPEAIDLEYDGEDPPTAGFIAAIIGALMRSNTSVVGVATAPDITAASGPIVKDDLR